MIIQLNPMIPMTTPMGKGYAIALCDYSQEHDSLWVVADDKTGEIWWWPNGKVRMQVNISMQRTLDSDHKNAGNEPHPRTPSPASRLV